MKNRKILKFVFAAMFTILISISSFVLADVGNINRYSGGSSSSSHSSSSSSSSSSHISSSRSSSSGSSSSSSSGANFGTLIGAIFAITIVVIVVATSKRKVGNINVPSSIKTDTKNIAEKIRKDDPAFSEQNFLSWAKDVFIKLQAAWTARDWKAIRPFESNELFEQHNAQLNEYIKNNKINVIERLSVESAELMGYRVDGDKEIVEVYLKAVMKDYIIDATTKQVLEGNKDTDWHMKYKLTFARKLGVKTSVGTSNKSTTNCPNCGAPTEITSSGQCEYCGSIITTGEHDFVLTNLEGIQ